MFLPLSLFLSVSLSPSLPKAMEKKMSSGEDRKKTEELMERVLGMYDHTVYENCLYLLNFAVNLELL